MKKQRDLIKRGNNVKKKGEKKIRWQGDVSEREGYEIESLMK